MASSRSKVHYVCSDCGASSSKWAGQCSDCGKWNTMQEAVVSAGRGRAWAGGGGSTTKVVDAQAVDVVAQQYQSTGMAELDRVLGGGMVAGSVVLIGGDPGIGKSTLLLQMAAGLCDRDIATLYVSGEESLSQVGMRARRLSLAPAGLKLLADTSVESILQHARNVSPAVLIIDSIQTMFTQEMPSAPGSVSQVRESAARLTRFAKDSGASVFLVGHVTKEGALAGPRVLEHMVDAVLYFESEADQRFRVVRTAKNRFGAANELGIFAMTDIGLRGVSNPSAIFLSRHPDPVPGSVVTVTREGTRPLLVEIQALVDDSSASSPRRVALGLEPARMAMLLAVAHRHAGVALAGQDVFANVVGGVRVTETGADLPLVMAVLSSLRERVLPNDMVVFGEVGLSGEIRPVQNGEERLQAAAQHGFKTAVLPRANKVRRVPDGLDIRPVSRLQEALEVVFDA